MARKASATLTRPWQGCAGRSRRLPGPHGEAAKRSRVVESGQAQAAAAREPAAGLAREPDGELAGAVAAQRVRGAADDARARGEGRLTRARRAGRARHV